MTLAFAGDVHFADQVADLLDDPAAALADVRPYLSGADLTMVNLETAVTERGTPAPKAYRFRAPATALAALSAAGVDVVTMANNHAVDYGETGLRDTLAAAGDAAALDPPVRVVGIGADEAAAYAPATYVVRGLRVGVLAGSQVPEWTRATWPAGPDRPGIALSDPADRLVAAVRRTARTVDTVVVYLHWGTQYVDCPDPGQRRTLDLLRDAGADVVVGSHSHRVQGSGWAGRTFVAYGLGNFVWYSDDEPDARTGVLTVTLDATGAAVAQHWQPLLVSRDGVPRRPAPADERRLADLWAGVRGCAGLAGAPDGGAP